MSVLTPGQTLGETVEELEAADLGAADVPAAPGRRALFRYVAMPAFLALVCLVLYLWVQGKELDSIEQRLVNADKIRDSIVDHVKLAAASTVLVVLIAVPLGILLTRAFARWMTPAVIGLANIGQMVPSIGVLVLLALTWSIGFRPAVVALVAYSVLPVLRNTMIGLQQVDRFLIEAGRGMGMGKLRVLARIELPLAVPVILAGVRTGPGHQRGRGHAGHLCERGWPRRHHQRRAVDQPRHRHHHRRGPHRDSRLAHRLGGRDRRRSAPTEGSLTQRHREGGNE